mgnify:CR=1 FL=1
MKKGRKELIVVGDRVLIRLEESDARRVVHMGAADPDPEYSLYGYSTGRWDGNTLKIGRAHV